MDESEARDIAVDYLLARMPEAVGWQMQGPCPEVLVRAAGRREYLVFDFWRRGGSVDEPSRRVGVDPETREAFLV